MKNEKSKLCKTGIDSWYALAKLAEINESTIANTRKRNGYLSFKNTCKIAGVLNISLDALNEWRGK